MGATLKSKGWVLLLALCLLEIGGVLWLALVSQPAARYRHRLYERCLSLKEKL